MQTHTTTGKVKTANPRSFAWQYDSLYRLTNEVVAGASSGNLGYEFDRVGNRTNRTGTLGTLGSQAPTFNTNDWLQTDAYDNNGNTLWSTNGTATGPYYYDVENRLTNFGSVTVTYNGDGQRVKKVVSGVTTLYLVDGLNPSGYAQVLEELTAGVGTNYYTYGLDLISQRRAASVNSTNFFGYDGHGSTRFLVDGGGTVANVFVYDAYGTLIASDVPAQTAYLYCGEQFDADLGFYYLRARYLNPNTGRFWTMDDHEGDQEAPKSLHLYNYAEGEPVDNVDPSGHFIEGVLTAIDICNSIFSQMSPTIMGAAVTAGAAGTSRPLTQGEIDLATSMFGGKINYTTVNVFRKKQNPLHPKDTLITPNGNIYANPKGTSYSTDYSSVSIYPAGVPIEYTSAIFIHEMTHVWQYQTTGSIIGRALYTKYDYNYSKLGTIKFTEYGIEQQGDIVSDYYTLRSGYPIIKNGKRVQNPPSLQTYQKVTSPYFP